MCHYAEVKKTGPQETQGKRMGGRVENRNTGMEVLLASRDYRYRYEICYDYFSRKFNK